MKFRGKYDKTKAPALSPVPDAAVEIEAAGVKITKGELLRQAWESGVLYPVVLREHQFSLHTAILDTPPLGTRPIICSRRFGKTMTVLTVVEELARQHPGTIIRLAFPTGKQAQTTIMPNWRKVLRTCPEDLKPVDRSNGDEGGWIWPKHCGPCKCGAPWCWAKDSNGPSSLYIAGTDDGDQRERLRGAETHWAFLDEAASQKELTYIVDDILGPQLDETGGRMVMITTPPKSLAHEFMEFWERGEREGLLFRRTIFDNTHQGPDKLRAICEKRNPQRGDESLEQHRARLDAVLAAGADQELAKKAGATSTWLREYLSAKVNDEGSQVCPEFSSKEHVVEAVARPSYVDRYVFIDDGQVSDFMAFIFAEWDFAAGKLRVLDELLMRHENTNNIAKAAKAKEVALWGRGGTWEDDIPKGKGGPRRYYDDPRGMRFLADLTSAHGYVVLQADKSPGDEANSRAVRYHMSAGHIEIDKRCKALIIQCKDGIFKEKASGKHEFERSKTHGHLDAFASLALGVRVVNWDHNPIPKGETQNARSTFYPTAAEKPLTKTAKRVKGLFRGAFAY